MSLAQRFGRVVDSLLGGRGEASITVPVMDGPLKPNDRIEHLPLVAEIDGVDNLALLHGDVLATSGPSLLRLRNGQSELVERFSADIAALAVSPAGALAIGLDGGGSLIRGGNHDGLLVEDVLGAGLLCPTAMVFLDEDTLLVANGSSGFPAAKWQHDLLSRAQTGSLIRVDLAGRKARIIAHDLAFPAGLCLAGGQVVFAESWAHRIMILDLSTGVIKPVLEHLPVYPARIIAAKDGGFWFTAYSSRTQLQEFVLRERRYCARMMEEVDPRYWVAPALSSGSSFLEPLQSGGVIRLGIHKPWAPTRSYGFVARLDAQFRPLWSAHSRADGWRHGIVSACEVADGLLVASKGKGEVLLLESMSAPAMEKDAAR